MPTTLVKEKPRSFPQVDKLPRLYRSAEPHLISYEEYCRMPEDPYLELIAGVLYQMPLANSVHQIIASKLNAQFRVYIDSHKNDMQVLGPVNVRLFPKNNTIRHSTNLIPDIAVANTAAIDKLGFFGAPLLVVEILSSSNKEHDTITKLQLYEEAGVPEYWIIDPEDQTVQVSLLKDDKYEARRYEKTDVIPVEALPGFNLNLVDIFA
jgi:Uma2 family endonuclease